MINLFKSEWSRIMKVTVLVAVGHVILLLFMLNFGLLFSTVIGFKISLVLFYGFYGFLLAVLQMRLYKDQSQWVYLLNRPLSAHRVFMGLFCAVLLGLFISVVLPVALVTWVVDLMGNSQIDWRHYSQLLYLLGVAVSFYLTGVFLTLIRNRWFALLLILPILPLMSLNLGGQVFLLQAAVLAVLFAVVLLFFKMNLQQRPQGRGLPLILAVVLQWSAFTLIMAVLSLVQLTAEEIEYLNSRHTEGAETTYPDQFRAVTYLDSKQTILTGLSDLNTEQARLYKQQSVLNDAFRIRKRVWFHPTKQQIQLMDERALVLTDEINHRLWTFSHDEMLFIGTNTETLEAAGYMGPSKQAFDLTAFNPEERFAGVPWIEGKQLIVGHVLYRFDEGSPGLTAVFTAKTGEYLLNVLQQQGQINTLISNQHLYVFDAIEVQKNTYPLRAVVVMPLPDDYNNLWDVSVIQIKDEFLLSFLYGKDPRKDAYSAAQLTYRFDLSGAVELLTTRELNHDEGLVMRYVDYLVSPWWTVVTDRLPPLPARDRYLQQRPWPLPMPIGLLLALSVVAVACFVVTWLWSRQRQLSTNQSLLWALTNAVTGVPGLLAFHLLNQKIEKINVSAGTDDSQASTPLLETNHV